MVGTRVPSMSSAPVPWMSTFCATVGWSQGLRRSHQSSLAGLRPVPRWVYALVTLGGCPSFASALEMLWDFGNPSLLPVTNTWPLRRATKAPVGTFTHHTMPS